LNNIVIVRVDEIGLKSGNKMLFMKQLKNNIESKFKDLFSCKILGNRIYLFPKKTFNNRDLDNLGKIFGISSYSVAKKIDKDFEKMEEEAYKLVIEALNNDFDSCKSFRISVNRADKSFPMISPEIAARIGEYVLSNIPSLTVDLTQPDINIEIDIRPEGVYLFKERVRGPSGLPVGVSSTGTVLLSGGIDSPVAALLMLRRGMVINGVNFYSPPFTGPKSLDKIIKISSIISEYTPFPFHLYVVPLTKIQMLFKDLEENQFSVVLQRRSMMRIADKISNLTGTKVLITGESLGQVASQTVENILTISESTQKVIFRPLIGSTKNETIEISKKFGLYETSILPYEDSCSVFVPQNPATKAQLRKIKQIESYLPEVSVLEDEVINESKKYEIRDGKIEEIDVFKMVKGGIL